MPNANERTANVDAEKLLELATQLFNQRQPAELCRDLQSVFYKSLEHPDFKSKHYRIEMTMSIEMVTMFIMQMGYVSGFDLIKDR